MRKTTLVLWRGLGLAALLYAGWSGYAGWGEDESVVTVKLRESVFHIPERYALSGTTPFWLKWMLASTPGLDDSSAVIRFKVPREEVRRALPTYSFLPHVDFFTAILRVLSDEELARYQDPEWGFHGDAWYGRGRYKDRAFEPLGETGWYRMYQSPNKIFWRVIRQRPDPSTRPPGEFLDFSVAACHATEGGLQTTDCLTYARSDRIVIDFHIDEENLVLIDEVRAFLLATVLAWKQPEERRPATP